MSEYFEILNGSKKFSKTFSSFDDNNKTTELNNQATLKIFKNIVESSTNLTFKDKSLCFDDSFLYRFLYVTKFNCDNAMDLLTNYLLYKQKSHLWQNINIFDEKIRHVLTDGILGLVRERDRRGRKVVIFTASNWNTEKYSLIDIYRAFLITLDNLLEDIQNQALGFVVIVDWTNFSAKQSACLSLTTLKHMVEGLQNYMPARIKGIHFIAQSWYVELVFSTIKTLFVKKIKKRFYIHGNNLSSLHKFVSKDILPPELGGEGSGINYLDWFHQLVSRSQYSERPQEYRITKTLNYTKSPI